MAPALYDGVSLSAERHGAGGLMFYTNGCAPLLGVKRTASAPRCLKNNDEIFDYIAAHPELRTVILASRWALWVEGTPYNFAEDEKEIDLTDAWGKENNEASRVVAERALDRTLAALVELNRNVVMISQVPEIGYDVPSAYFIARRTGRDLNQIIAPAYSAYLNRTENTRRILDATAEKYGAMILDPSQSLCDSSRCVTIADDRLLYMDAYHLSIFGSRSISHLYDSFFESLALEAQP
ncbi:MAG: hypothetical protein Fur002_26240 [Anaerolineales bacterium]